MIIILIDFVYRGGSLIIAQALYCHCTVRPLHRKRGTSLEMAFKLVIHFTGKSNFIRNGIHAYTQLF